jgi:murein DD-endopeptidase MepM/ murein hydrolase activator NlpD
MIAATKHTEKISRQLVVQSYSYDELIYKAINKEQMALSRPAIMPISKKDLTNMYHFGWRSNHPIHKDGRPHNGTDFSAPSGTCIYATGDGTVIKTEYNSGGYGRMITIDHGFGYYTRYAHMQSFKVVEGNEVKRGQLIGTVGNTGTSSGPHVHYEVLKNGKPINPISYFYADLSLNEYILMIEQAQTNNEVIDNK